MSGDRFLSRWSKRKAQGRSRPSQSAAAAAPTVDGDPSNPEALTDTLIESSTATPLTVADPGTETGEEDIEMGPEELAAKAEALGLPSLDSLGPGSDFKPFMSGNVPKQLRTLALRKLWGSNPILANVDGLVDYGEDFTDAARVVKNMQTAYQVGRGYLRDEEPETEEKLETTANDIEAESNTLPQTEAEAETDVTTEPEMVSEESEEDTQSVASADTDTTLRNSIPKP